MWLHVRPLQSRKHVGEEMVRIVMCHPRMTHPVVTVDDAFPMARLIRWMTVHTCKDMIREIFYSFVMWHEIHFDVLQGRKWSNALIENLHCISFFDYQSQSYKWIGDFVNNLKSWRVSFVVSGSILTTKSALAKSVQRRGSTAVPQYEG